MKYEHADADAGLRAAATMTSLYQEGARMKPDQIDALFARLQNAPPDDLYDIEADFFLAIQGAGPKQWPDFAVAFLVLSNWLGNSLRCGVSAYYQTAPAQELQIALRYLRRHGAAGLADTLASGIQNYHEYENANYPGQWIDQAEAIDRWIFSHEDSLYQWMRDILLENRASLCALLGGTEAESAHAVCL